ncbi:carbohydrate kinase family protein [Devosia chinhatensis]|uniref:Carbohydrate kinase PfkB domain-containing protein n=1 Tax=Devosia chinhatensis TaxID=429727 RepID=A0A0F5FKP1_9HYPH|nr:carbohydrate kinase family protein [Devosia chinhatensis]KKB09464.1 hypothetical protein VE26_05955 [Devosia chinhatensis]
MKRLAFLGAMNRDLVAEISGDIVLQKLDLDARPLVETPVSDAIAAAGARLLAGLGAHDYLGGSAFNAARVAALLNGDERKLDLVFFGIAGQVGASRPHLDALAAWNVAGAGITQSLLSPATCLAMVEPAGRTLLTAIGANADIADYLRDEAGNLAADLARCTLVHVTSYLDPSAPGLVADLLQRARRLNPALLVSLDPGMAWIASGSPDLPRLFAEADILHLNAEESAHLCGADAEAIGALAEKLHGSAAMIVARNHSTIAIHEAQLSRTLPDRALPATVVDSNGAGDTFCGAFLWRLLADDPDPLEAARFAFDLARHKIGTSGPLTSDSIRQLLN